MSAPSVGLLPLTPRRITHVILGSLPSVMSLASSEYYAHPRNHFWPLIECLYGVARTLPYRQRIAALKRHNVGVWDVLASAKRHGSLDAAIERTSACANDLTSWLAGQPVVAIGLNGTMAANMFARHCAPALEKNGLLTHTQVFRLPSTSPANATHSFTVKLAAWQNFTAWQG